MTCPICSKPVQQKDRGRRRVYCSDSCRQRAYELRRLEQWKAEAIPLLDQFERCHDLLPTFAQAQLGHSKADAVEAYLAFLQEHA